MSFRQKRYHQSIGRRLLWTLGFISALSIVSSVIAFVIFNQVRQNYQQAVDNYIPSIFNAKNLSSNTNELTSLTLELLNFRDVQDQQTTLNTLRQRIDSNEQRYQTLLDQQAILNDQVSLREIGQIHQQIIKNARQQVQQLQDYYQLTQQLDQQQTTATQAITQLRILLRQILADYQLIQTASDRLPAVYEFRADVNGVENVLLQMLQARTASQVGSDKADFQAQLRSLITRNNNLSADYTQPVSTALSSLFALSNAPDQDLFATKQNQLKTIRDIVQTGLTNNQLSQQISQKIDQYANTINASINQSSQASLSQQRWQLALLGLIPLSILITSLYLLYWFVYPSIIRRLETLTVNTKRIAEGDLSTSIESFGSDEIGSLSSALESFRLALIDKQKAEQRLVESQERYNLAIEGAGVGLWDWNLTEQVLFWSPYFKQIMHCVPDFIPSYTDFFGRVQADDVDRVAEQLQQHLLHREPFDVQCRIHTFDDRVVWVHLRGQALWDDQQQPTRMSGSMDDITELRQAEAELQYAQKLQSLVMDHIPDYVLVKQADHKIIYANSQFLNTYPVDKRDQVIGSAAIDFYPAHEAEVFLAEDRKAFENGYYETYETISLPNGEQKELYTQKIRFYDDDLPLILSLSRDVTEQRSYERRLQEVQDFQNLIMENLPDYVYVKDKDFKLVYANPACFTLYPEGSRDNIIGSTIIENFPEEEAQAFLAEDRIAFSEGSSEKIEKITIPTGEIKTLYTIKIRFYDLNNEPFLLGLSRDVTEREDLIERLTASNEELQNFAYVSSHDLQEPLRMISNFSALLMEEYRDQLDEDGQTYLNFIHDGASNMHALVQDLLSYARVDAEEAKQEEIKTENILQFVMDNLQVDIQAFNVKITHDSLPIICGSRVQFSRLLQNLLSNAIKYRQQDTAPVVHIGVKNQGQYWLFSITDNGMGMRPEYTKKIFIPFKRLHSRSEIKGTGIGLAICKKIVENMHGEIWAESELGQGSTFYLKLPKQNSELQNLSQVS